MNNQTHRGESKGGVCCGEYSSPVGSTRDGAGQYLLPVVVRNRTLKTAFPSDGPR
ncbi:hypothetical protein [Promicromonospora soli]